MNLYSPRTGAKTVGHCTLSQENLKTHNFNQETQGNSMKLQETQGNSRKLKETPENFRKLLETPENSWKLQETTSAF